MPNDPPKTAPANPQYVKRDKQINVRIDGELYDAASEKAYAYGLGPVIRALLRSYVRGETQFRRDDIELETTTAPRKRRPRKPRKSSVK